MSILAASFLGYSASAPAPPPPPPSGNVTFSYTGSDQTYTVPEGIDFLSAKLWGAGGGGGNRFRPGGGGGFTTNSLIPVTSGEILNVMIGQGGQGTASYGSSTGRSNTYGRGGASGDRNGASGGGMTALYRGDLFDSDVSLLLHMNGTNGSTTFTDSSSNSLTVTRSGNAQISTAESKFGGSSAYFDGNGDYLEIANNAAFDFGSNDFTIELWLYIPTGAGNDKGIIGKGQWPSSSNNAFLFYYGGSNELSFYYSTGSGWAGIANFSNSAPKDTWIHLAASRNGNNIRLFYNGSLTNTISTSAALATNTDPVLIGSGYLGNNSFNGYIDDLRITKGIARYLNNFTPLTTEFPDPLDQYFDNVSLLLHFSGTNGSTTFTDSSNSDRTPTFVGTPSITTSTSKWNTSSGNFASGRLEYSGYNLATTNDFTAEAWVYHPSSLADGQLVIIGQQLASPPLLTILNGKLSSQLSGGYTDGSTTFPKDQWVHVAISRSSSTCRLYLNGVQETSFSTSNGMSSLTVGGGYAWGTSSGLLLDDVRITNNVARYTANFNPPNREFSNSTSLISVAAGGGGGAASDNDRNHFGGAGGGSTGVNGGGTFAPGSGGSQSSGGTGGAATASGKNGSKFTGGNGASYGSSSGGGGGGGAGYYGGGGGGDQATQAAGGGGGGSSYTGLNETTTAGTGDLSGGASDSEYVAGVGTGGIGGNVSDPGSDGGNGYMSIKTIQTIVFDYTGATQTYVVPGGVTSITAKLWGGGGGSQVFTGTGGGGGGYATATLSVTPGETLTIYVGGGGPGNTGTNRIGANGGGSSAITRGSTPLIIAGAGGGSSSFNAGAGGGLVGLNGSGVSTEFATGGTQSAPGNGMPGGRVAGNPGVGYNGGDGSQANGYLAAATWGHGLGGRGGIYNADCGGGGGGGGYYGGGGGGTTGPTGAGSGGAGGSSFVPVGGTTIAGSGSTPGNSSDTDRGTAGQGASGTSNGNPGRVVIII